MTKPQLTREDLASMTLEQVGRAHADGQLDDLLGVTHPDVPDDGPLTREHLAQMAPDAIADAHQAGRLDDLVDADGVRERIASAQRIGDGRS